MFRMVSTVAEAEAQRLEVPEYEGWYRFAHLLNGYDVANELSLELAKLSHEKMGHYFQTEVWKGTLLELRLVLFFKARAYRFTGYPGYDPESDPDFREEIRTLLGAL